MSISKTTQKNQMGKQVLQQMNINLKGNMNMSLRVLDECYFAKKITDLGYWTAIDVLISAEHNESAD